jgi:hypothetical protein
MKRIVVLASAGLALWASASCSLIDSNGLHIGYSFDAQHFTEKVGDSSAGTLPDVACQAGQSPDPCAAAQSNLPAAYAKDTTVTCSAATHKCVATTTVRLPQLIDLRTAQTPLPSDAVQFGISAVAIDRIAYWVAAGGNTLNVATPPFDLYVAPQAAMDEHDANAVKLGSVASLPAGSDACADMVDSKGDPMAGSQRVCDVPLTQAGQAALSDYIKNYKTAPFKIIVAATINATGGTPVPAGMLDFFVRPSVTLSILK